MRNRNAKPTEQLTRAPRQLDHYGNYRLIALVSKGGMSSVHLAEDRTTGERVAIKLLDRHLSSSQFANRLFAEHTVSRRARHTGLVDVIDAGHGEDGRAYLVMEYLDGENLGDLADRGLLDMTAVIAIARQIAAALAPLHAANIVHCDLKPGNVVVLYDTGADGFPRIKVIDYGVAMMPESPPVDEGTIAGTPLYMAPEQWCGQPVCKSDVYSLGCMLYELLTGDVPFSGPLPRLLMLHTEALPPRVSSVRTTVPVELDRLIGRMLAKDPGLRPTVQEIEAELSRIARSLQVDEPARAAG